MKISENWLREWVNPPVKTEELAEQLTMAGLEVDSVTDAAAEFKGVVVGRVDSVESHPDADKLRVCQVDAGSGELLNIVCGAANVRKELRIPVAMIGAVLPGNFKIKKSKLRGVQSFGMLCSEKELGIAESSEGLMELPDDAPIGTDIREYLELDDRIIEVDLTPNRGDCTSMAGIAREVGVLNRCDVTAPEIPSVDVALSDIFTVQVKNSEDCPRYLGRIISGVNSSAKTPIWMQERLRRGGIRSLGPMVDVTNYVLLELGHPMHAFDLDLLKGSIHVRQANVGEKLTMLDGSTAELNEGTLVIADDEKAVAMAGIMGGQDTAVSDNTKNLFLECAFFSPLSIAGKARQYGLQTDSSFRFERGVNPASLPVAMERATQLLIQIAGGEAGPIVDVCSQEYLPQAKPIALRRQRVERLLGVSIPDDQIKEMLERLNMSVEVNKDGWLVTAPTFRFDISIEADLIEEIGRIYGYDQLPSRHSTGNLVMNAISEGQNKLSRTHSILIDRDYQEVVTYSFVDPDLQKMLDPEHDAIALANPISSEMGVMRTSLWTGLIQTAAYNLNRQQGRIRIFESGLKFILQDNEIKQINVISGAISGSLHAEQWAVSSQKSDFYDIKSDVEALLQLTANKEDFIFVASEHPALHPGQSARILYDNKTIGWIGALHPLILKKQGISDSIFLFELDLEAILKAEIPQFKVLSKYPSTRRDLAIVVDEQITSKDIFDAIRGTLSDQLKEIRLFDVYRGKGVDSGRKSLALGLILQESSRTLIDQDMDSAIEQVMEKLKEQFDATLRE